MPVICEGVMTDLGDITCLGCFNIEDWNIVTQCKRNLALVTVANEFTIAVSNDNLLVRGDEYNGMRDVLQS